MKALLVYPTYPDTFWSFKSVLPFVSKKAAFPPLGLLTIAAMLPKTWEIRLVDTNVAPLGDVDLEWAELVLVSAMLVQVPSAQDIVRRAKRAGKIVIVGGPAFNAQRERFSGVDHFVLGEAETVLPDFLKDFELGVAKAVYESTERPDLDSTPFPVWELLNFKDYVSMSVQYSRGCPFDCEFCDIVAMNGRGSRVKSPEHMLQELQGLYDAGWRDSVFIVDDNFIGNIVNVKDFLPKLAGWQKQRNYPFKLMTEASVNLAQDSELLRMMSDANFHKVFIGIETPSVESLKECGKKQNVATDFGSAVREIQQHGMQVMGGFIVGFDSDTSTIFEQQVRFIQDIGVVTAMIGVLNALPRTRLWRRLKSEGRLLDGLSGENTDACLNFIPAMGREVLLEGYKEVVSILYSSKEYYARISKFLSSYAPLSRGRLFRTDIQAFMKSMWAIGVVSHSRFFYWKLIFKTLLTKPKALPVVVELAILGLHFERVARRIVAV
ncbi:B12-binding domain-containing radical SAM protein [Desulfovibrio ferrophilus]|uniref:Cobalamin B12-binding domain-containing protein n=1 Tax=Desulfovibrio ferrophilus TaxID=241368 RepID=A0A2Z6AVD5_9BACT|nr:B12-binding domain-containing radical SAM protein [Desulfovibrio ferrophilus]BBD07209.1 cobalamin B12-binding domain-containing protein [Desulfovibrio ferrophilus]